MSTIRLKNLGTIGHIDHGKTTLTAALWGYFSKQRKDIKDVDNHQEEKERGITINTNTVRYKTQNTTCNHTDCPGHADYVKNMITGAANFEIAMLVVSFVDGPQEQTKEHIRIAGIIGIKKYIVVFNKVDQVNEEDRETYFEINKEEILGLLSNNKISTDSVEFILVSATTALKEVQDNLTPTEFGIKALEKIGEAIDKVPEQDFSEENKKPFVLNVDDTYNITGRGIAVAGRIKQGSLKIGDTLSLIASKKVFTITVNSMESFHQKVEEAFTGANVAIVIKSTQKMERKDIARGSILCKLGAVDLVHFAKVQLYLFPSNEGGRKSPINVGYIPHIFVGPRDTPMEILSINGTNDSIIEPGQTGECIIACSKPMPLEKTTSIIIRETITIGLGLILEKYEKCPEEILSKINKKSHILNIINTTNKN